MFMPIKKNINLYSIVCDCNFRESEVRKGRSTSSDNLWVKDKVLICVRRSNISILVHIVVKKRVLVF